MNNVDKKSSKTGSAIRGLLVLIVVVAALAAGRLLVTESASAGGADGGSAAVASASADDVDLGEALMHLEGQLSNDGSAALAAGWFTCNVHRTGPGWGNVYLRLSSSSFTQRWFRAQATQKKEILAAGLTALSAGKKVQVYVTGTAPSPYGEIRACYVLK